MRAMKAPAQPRLDAIGEDALVRRIARALPVGRGVVAGIGDDCAVVRPVGRGQLEFLKTDCVVEGVHFAPSAARSAVGWKAMARVISDFAAMGARPRHALVTVCIPPDRPVAELAGLYAGIRKAATRFGVGVVGGELSRSPGGLMVSVAMTGEGRRWVRRGGGKPGDALYVSGRLGGSGGGRHLRFEPRIEQGEWLARRSGVHAMMDLSDGLASDLPRLARGGGCGFEVNVGWVPRHRGASVRQALSEGEDYELLVAIDPAKAAAIERAWGRRFPALPFTRIGRLTRPGAVWVGARATGSGWDHFGGGGR
jgi:thiamine-monophosphate kinase